MIPGTLRYSRNFDIYMTFLQQGTKANVDANGGSSK